MSFTVIFSRRFLKTANTFERGGRGHIVRAAEEAAHLLSLRDPESLTMLRVHWRDHALKGNRYGTRELHLSMDDLLLYRVDLQAESIELLDIVSHEELRKQ